MKKSFARYLAAALGLSLLFAGQAPPKMSLPILTTSAGQSSDVTTLNIVLDEAGIGYDYCDVPKPEMLADGVGLGGRESGPGFHIETTTDQTRFPAGTPFKAVIFAIGASLKGNRFMSSASTPLDGSRRSIAKLQVLPCKISN